MSYFDLTRPSEGERFWLWRRSKGWNQARAGAALGIGRGLLSAFEAGRVPENPRKSPQTPSKIRQRPSLPLLLALARRRSGYPLPKVARAVGVSRTTILAWERAGDPRLVGFWEARGFLFGR